MKAEATGKSLSCRRGGKPGEFRTEKTKASLRGSLQTPCGLQSPLDPAPDFRHGRPADPPPGYDYDPARLDPSLQKPDRFRDQASRTVPDYRVFVKATAANNSETEIRRLRKRSAYREKRIEGIRIAASVFPDKVKITFRLEFVLLAKNQTRQTAAFPVQRPALSTRSGASVPSVCVAPGPDDRHGSPFSRGIRIYGLF